MGWKVRGLFSGVGNGLTPRRPRSFLFSEYWVFFPGCQVASLASEHSSPFRAEIRKRWTKILPWRTKG